MVVVWCCCAAEEKFPCEYFRLTKNHPDCFFVGPQTMLARLGPCTYPIPQKRRFPTLWTTKLVFFAIFRLSPLISKPLKHLVAFSLSASQNPTARTATPFRRFPSKSIFPKTRNTLRICKAVCRPDDLAWHGGVVDGSATNTHRG